MISQPQTTIKSRKQELAGYGLAAAGIGATALIAQPASAQSTDPVAGITTTVTTLEGIATAVAGVALSALAFRVGLKIFNRMTVKG